MDHKRFSHPSVMSGGSSGAWGVSGVQTGPAERVPAAGGSTAGSGPIAHQDRCQQDTQNL